jgi:hypothetical protein
VTIRDQRSLRAVLACACAALVTGGTLISPGHGSSAAAAEQQGQVNRQLWDDRITESSGLARSTYKRPLLWTHNDSGDSSRVFAIRRDGNTRAVLRIKGAGHVDWEDISTGPRRTIWVGDIGDNGWSRHHITVYRFKEPKTVKSRKVDAVSYDFRYADGPRDAEAMMVRPRTGRLFVVSKVEDGGAIYRAPKKLSTSKVNVLKRVASAPHTVTGGSFAPDGKSFVLTNYTRFFTFSRIKGSVKSETSKVNNSAQGESIEIGRGGKRVFIGEEGDNSPVYAVRYKAP